MLGRWILTRHSRVTVSGRVTHHAYAAPLMALAVKRAHDAGVGATRLADALGVHRPTLYRLYMTRPEGLPLRSGGAAGIVHGLTGGR